ncbi:hypothetical protein PHET_09270, partial [Paragonimus heterotremus]
VPHALTNDPLPTVRHKKPLRRGLQLGTVSRAVKEFETSVSNSTDSDETNCKDSQNGPTNVGVPRASKSHSITETTQLKIWNAHNMSKVTLQRQRDPDRKQVGRLQELFEKQATIQTLLPNGTKFSHRASHA